MPATHHRRQLTLFVPVATNHRRQLTLFVPVASSVEIGTGGGDA